MNKTIDLNTCTIFTECVLAGDLSQILLGTVLPNIDVELYVPGTVAAKNIKIIRKYETVGGAQTGALHEFRFRDGRLDVVMVRSRCGWCIYDQYLDRSHKNRRNGFVYPNIITSKAFTWAADRHTMLEYFKINKPESSCFVDDFNGISSKFDRILLNLDRFSSNFDVFSSNLDEIYD